MAWQAAIDGTDLLEDARQDVLLVLVHVHTLSQTDIHASSEEK